MENQNLELNQVATDALRESAKWSMFLSILGFIGIGFMVLFSVFIGIFMAAMPDNEMGNFPFPMKGFLSLIYLVIALVYVFPVFYLYKYASGMKNALNYKNSNDVANAFVYLKSHHKFLGIAAIVIISLYILIFIVAIIGGFIAASRGY